MVILGGGVCKHQICNSMLFRNGADYSVFINTGNEYDGSDSGARPDEAISWGKIRAGAQAVKVRRHALAALMRGLLRRDDRLPAAGRGDVGQGALGRAEGSCIVERDGENGCI